MNLELYKLNGAIPSIEDERDYKIDDKLISCAPNLPSEYDNGILDYVLDQGTSSTCVACSLSLLRYFQEYDQSNNRKPYSPSYIYANRLEQDHQGEGMSPRQALKTLKDFGDTYLKDFPGFYSYKKAAEIYKSNKEKLDNFAHPFRISKYYRVSDIIEIKTAIYTLKGVTTMIPVYDCMYSVNKDGIVNFDPVKEYKNRGYHQVTLKGWIEDGWIMQNSWGKKFGKNGTCILPYEYPLVESWAVIDEILEEKFDIE